MKFKPTLNVLSAAIISISLMVTSNVMADDSKRSAEYIDNCQYLPLANNFENPVNHMVCVDAPVTFKKVKAIFDMTTGATGNDVHTGLRHMTMLGDTIKKRIAAGQIEAEDVSVIGVIHGSTAVMQLATAKQISGETKKLIDQIFTLKNEGVNINLEVCGATVNGIKEKMINNGASKEMADAALTLYTNLGNVIHTNQGAIGRMIDLQQQKYTLIKE